ncbi:MAG: Ig-like domain-containing protein [Acetatifactor sp.]|nr:Ig-like domain-containing protein [Acetatifactor sp.]
MERVFRKTRRLASSLLAMIMIITSVPQAGIYAGAANQTDMEAAVSSQNESDIVEAVSSQDGTERGYAVFSDTGEYLIDDTLGVTLTDVAVTPRSYTTTFSYRCDRPVASEIRILYTKDKELATQFFPGLTKISLSDINASEFYLGDLENWKGNITQDENGDSYYEQAGDFVENANGLSPNTTYYYRIVYWEHSTYYFLSLPGEFTTNAPLETSAVKISSPKVEEVGYSRTKIVWTVENPNNEYIFRHFLRDINTDQIKGYGSVSLCQDENGDSIPGKYEVILSTQRDVGTYRPELCVYTGDVVETTIRCGETVTLEPSNAIADAQVSFTEEVGYDDCQTQVKISPWYEIDNGYWITGNIYYRQQGDTEWQKQTSRPYFRSGETTMRLSDLAKETAYEYYIEFIPDDLQESVWKIGSETQPRSFSTKEILVFEDSLFPDDVLRNFIKKQIGISEEEIITSDRLDSLTSLSWILEQDGGSTEGSKKGSIRSLEGIQYVQNLTSINFYNHAITDASILGTMPQLKSISLIYNELTEMPDLSGLVHLQKAEFLYNYIMPGITADKLPAEFVGKNPEWISTTTRNQRPRPLPVQAPSQEEIKAKYAQLAFAFGRTDTYAIQPNTKSPYLAGRLSDESLQNSLDVLNFIRYVAGIPCNVTLDESNIELAQTGALVNCVNDELTHYPTQPKGFPDDLYKLGYEGCSSSNLAMGYQSIVSSTTGGWLYDSDPENLAKGLGHRAWMLNSQMQTTGFGHVGRYSALYVSDAANLYDGKGRTTISDFVTWPAQNTPIELMGKGDKYGSAYDDYGWTVSLGTDYANVNPSDVTVTLKDTGTGRTWTFSQELSKYDVSPECEYFHALGRYIVFRPKCGDIVYDNGSRFEVTISGLKDRFGEEKTLSYTVNFFAASEGWDVYLSLDVPVEKRMAPGETLNLSAHVKYDEPTDDVVTWVSSNPDVAKVEGESKENGYGFWLAKLTAVSEGAAVITVTYRNKKSYYYVTVTGTGESAHDYYISQTELHFDLAEGVKTETLFIGDGDERVQEVTWSSQNEGVAAVSGQDGFGVVTPKGSGTTQITAKVGKDVEFTCQVTVENNKLTAISLNPQECTLEKGSVRQLRAYLSPSDTTLSKELLWTSDHPEVASVDASGKVTALSKGTAVITVSPAVQGTTSAALTAQCTVMVYETATPAEDNIPSGLQALTNVQTKLSDVSLKDYEGWEWENGNISLAQFAGQQEKSFMAVYRKDGYADYRTALNVSLATLTGISITADKTVLGTGGTAAADIQWKLSGLESVLSVYADALQWSSSNPAVLTVTAPDAAGQTATNATAQTLVATGVTLRAGSTPGKATVTAQITLGGKTYTARQTYTVVDGAVAEFGTITMTDGFTETIRDGRICYEGRLEDSTGTLSLTVTNATKLTVKSSNAKVLSTGKIQVESGNINTFRIPLTMKAAGMAKITLTANDAAKSKTEILCYVRDARPNLGESVVTVNKLRTDGAALYIYPNDGYVVTGYELGGADAALFETLTAGTERDSYCLKAKKDTAKGNYKLTVKVTTAANTSAVAENASSYELPLTVKVTEQAPKYKVKQSAKANVFYSDLGAPRLTITSEETLTGLTLTGCDFKLSEESGTDGAAGDYIIVPDLAGTLTSSCNTKGTLMLTFEGYETISAPFTVGIESKKPNLALNSKTITLYPNVGVTDARLQIKSGNQILSMEDITATLRNADGCILTKTDNGLTLSGAGLLSGGSFTRAVTLKAEISLTCHNWAEEIVLPLTVKADPGKPALKLQKSTLQLNAGTATLAYDMAETEVLWKSGGCFDSDKALSVSAADAKSQAVIHDSIVFEQTGSKLIARLNNRSVAAGTYKFKVHAPGISAAPVSLTVKVVSTDLSKAVKLSAKGSIDVLNRAGSCVTVTPSLKSLNGQITDVKLSGDFAHLFRAELNEKNQIVIHARETDDKGRRVALITKYNYDVNLVLTVRNAEGETLQFATLAVRLKLKQSKPKVAVIPKSPVFFSGAYNSVKLDVAASLKGAANPEITSIELVNQTDLFDYNEGILTMRDTGTAVKGKSYSLQLRVTFRDQADNEKATIVKVNAKVK